jgi:hypothetical protein
MLSIAVHNASLGTDFWNIPFENIARTLYVRPSLFPPTLPTPTEPTSVVQLFAIVINLHPPTIALIKMAMLLLYLRLFPSATLRIATITILTLTAQSGDSIIH